MKPPSKCRRSGLLALALAVLAATLANLSAQPAQPARSSPQWVRDGVVYEIFPRNFSSEGNFNGITARLDELKDLGVTILWLMPIHPLGEKMRKGTLGSPYAVRDYYAINPDYGTEADLKRLVSEAHQRGLKVIIDVVANHTAWDSVLMAAPGVLQTGRQRQDHPAGQGMDGCGGIELHEPKAPRIHDRDAQALDRSRRG
jgi:cyclomaltodextrinase